MNRTSFQMAQLRLSAALVNSQQAHAAHAASTRRITATVAARQVAANTMRDQGNRWAKGEVAAVAAAVTDSQTVLPSEIGAAAPATAPRMRGTAPLSAPDPATVARPVADGRSGLSDARRQAESARDGLRGEAEALRKWQTRRAKRVRAAGGALLLLLVAIGLTFSVREARRWLETREAVTTATAVTPTLSERATASAETESAADSSTTSPGSTFSTEEELPPTHLNLPGQSAPDEIVFQSNVDGDYEIYIMDATGGERRALTDNNADDKFPRVSPDGRQILFVSWRDGNQEIYVMNRDGANQRRLTNHPADDELPAWSGMGQAITFQSNRDDGYDIYEMSLDGGQPRRVTKSPEREGHTSWSVNGRLAYNVDLDGYWQIYTADADGHNPQRLTNSTYDEWSPEWSPDGQWLLFLSERDSRVNPGMYRMRDNGDDVRLIYNGPTPEWGAVWSADGSQVIFAADQPDGTSNLYSVSVAGGEARLLTERGGYPSWARAINPDVGDGAQEALGVGQQVRVQADIPRNETGITVSAGQYVSIRVVAGEWQAGPAPTWQPVGGNGDTSVPGKASFPAPDRPLLMLVAGIGTGRPLAVGDQIEFLAGQGGALWLGANDDDFDDNSGALTVEVVIDGGRQTVGANQAADATVAVIPEQAVIDSTTPTPPLITTPIACPVSAAERWVNGLWAEYREQLGCSLGPPVRPDGAVQYFTRGTTIWREDTDRIYVLYASGAFADYPDPLANGEEYYVSPLLKNGFGYLWQNDAVVQAGLGEPLAIEIEAADFTVQDFAGGVLIYFNDHGAYDFVLVNDTATWMSYP